jgi:hypothetical protein
MLALELAFGVATLLTVAGSISANPLLGFVRILTVAGLTISMIALVGRKFWGWWLAAVVAIFGLMTGGGPLHHVIGSTEAIPNATIFELSTGCLVMIFGIIGFMAEKLARNQRNLNSP